MQMTPISQRRQLRDVIQTWKERGSIPILHARQCGRFWKLGRVLEQAVGGGILQGSHSVTDRVSLIDCLKRLSRDWDMMASSRSKVTIVSQEKPLIVQGRPKSFRWHGMIALCQARSGSNVTKTACKANKNSSTDQGSPTVRQGVRRGLVVERVNP